MPVAQLFSRPLLRVQDIGGSVDVYRVGGDQSVSPLLSYRLGSLHEVCFQPTSVSLTTGRGMSQESSQWLFACCGLSRLEDIFMRADMTTSNWVFI